MATNDDYLQPIFESVKLSQPKKTYRNLNKFSFNCSPENVYKNEAHKGSSMGLFHVFLSEIVTILCPILLLFRSALGLLLSTRKTSPERVNKLR